MTYGHADRIMRIDLSTGSVIKQPPDSTIKHKYTGGIGLGIKILYMKPSPEF